MPLKPRKWQKKTSAFDQKSSQYAANPQASCLSFCTGCRVPVVRSSSPVVRPRPSTGNRTGCRKRDQVQALVDVAATYLETLPGEPADDHTVVMVHVNAEALDVPAGTPRVAPEDVPAGTSVDSGTCYVEGHGPIEPATAERLLCTAKVQGVLVGRGGKVLSLGRTRRLATRAQRRALKVRDRGVCQFPGCHTTNHLDAHHVVAWSALRPY
jgi:hypothetical protein